MTNQRTFVLAFFAAVTMVFLQATAMSQTADTNLANLTGGGAGARWNVLVANSGMTLIISAPDGRSLRTDYVGGANPEITLSDPQFVGLPDGTYSYELRLRPVLSAAAKEAIVNARGKDDDPEAERAARKRPGVPLLVQTGSFAILNGSIIVPGGVEGQGGSARRSVQPRMQASTFGNTLAKLRHHRMYFGARPDDVIADDQIVQGSECVGFDCVNGEVFDQDTIRMKENNTRLGFMDTSFAAGFPTNDWTIRANSSASGGSSFLAFVDNGDTSTGAETGTIIFQVDAGAPANSLRVASTGKVGLRTGTPALDLHINTSNTPAVRLEQNNSVYTAQTWDIGGNEANFFVRNVTGGTTLPFRIRPGAPTSSIDISAAGNVGIGTASPQKKLHVIGSDGAVASFPTVGPKDNVIFENNSNNNLAIIAGATSVASIKFFADAAAVNGGMILYDNSSNFLSFSTNSATERMRITSTGSVGIGTTTPDQLFTVAGEASKDSGGMWASISDERLKNINGRFTRGLNAVMRLQPIRFQYKSDNPLGRKSELEHVGFSAQAVETVIPEAVTRNGQGYLMINGDPILWTMLNAIKEQQQQIAELKAQVRKLRRAPRQRRR